MTPMHLSGDDLEAAYFLAHRFVDPARAAGRPVNAVIEQFCRRVDILWDSMSADGHECGCGGAESGQVLIDAATAAARLGISERHVRRLVNDLGGRKIAGVWAFDPQVVEEYAEERSGRA